MLPTLEKRLILIGAVLPLALGGCFIADDEHRHDDHRHAERAPAWERHGDAVGDREWRMEQERRRMHDEHGRDDEGRYHDRDDHRF